MVKKTFFAEEHFSVSSLGSFQEDSGASTPTLLSHGSEVSWSRGDVNDAAGLERCREKEGRDKRAQPGAWRVTHSLC